MKPEIKKLYDESYVIKTDDCNATPHTVKVFDPDIFANKILKLCQEYAMSQMGAYDWNSYDDMDDEERAAGSAAVIITGRINVLIDEAKEINYANTN